MHNVRLDEIQRSKDNAVEDAAAASLSVDLDGDWQTDESQVQFVVTVQYPEGSIQFEAEGDGRNDRNS